MKNIYLTIVLLTLIVSVVISQNNVGINNLNPDPSAVLDVTSSDKGILIPRMTTLQRINIVSPANGLLVFDTDTRSFWFYESVTASWKILINNAVNYRINDLDGDTYITLEGNPDDDTARVVIAGIEKFRFGSKTIDVLNTGNSVYIGEGAGKNDDLNNRQNIGIGTATLQNSIDRYGLIAIGDSALFNNGTGANGPTDANKNIAIGSRVATPSFVSFSFVSL